MKDKRNSMRLKKKITIRLYKKKLIVFKGQKVAGRVLDISETGVRLFTSLKLIAGDVIALVLKSDLFSLEDFNSTVVWAQEIEENNKRYTKAGVVFKKLSSDQITFLRQFLWGG